jgi:hypothetical protein
VPGAQPRLGLRQEITDPRVGRLRVEEPGQQGLLLRAMLGATLGHRDILVPLEEGGAGAEQRVLAGAMEQLEVRRVGAHSGQLW